MNSSSTEFTASDGRKFAFPVGIAFLLLAGLLFWREKETLWRIASGLGGILILAGAVAPAQLGPVYRGWMKMALAISKVTSTSPRSSPSSRCWPDAPGSSGSTRGLTEVPKKPFWR